MTTKRKIKTTVVPEEEWSDIDFKNPSKYYIVNCLLQRVYYHCRDRAVAEKAVKEDYNGLYKVRVE